MINTHDILETINMIDNENLDVRTITMGISLLDCIDSNIEKACTKVYDKICGYAEHLVQTGEDISREYGIPIVNKRIAVTPIAMLAERRRVRIVDHRDRQIERVAERPRDLAAEPVAEAGPDTDHRAAAHVDLPRGRNADARGLFRALFEQFAGERRDGREDRRPVAVKVDAARLGEKDGARFVDKAGLDGGAADVDAKQHAHEIASTNRRVMSRGRVIAVPTTAACTG